MNTNLGYLSAWGESERKTTTVVPPQSNVFVQAKVELEIRRRLGYIDPNFFIYTDQNGVETRYLPSEIIERGEVIERQRRKEIIERWEFENKTAMGK